MDFIKLRDEIHENAVAHGWWDGCDKEGRKSHEIIALIHSELSEALEEYRAGRPMVWHECADLNEARWCGCRMEYGERVCAEEYDCAYRERKPEGIAVELIDAVIRILDYLGYVGYEGETHTSLSGIDAMRLPELVARCHKRVSDAWTKVGEDEKIDLVCLSEVVIWIRTWIESRGEDFEKLIMEKHAYNATRPYRHGGKKL